jgi:methylmalonyl-CoA/ethylmalonyl-CoA epimerase
MKSKFAYTGIRVRDLPASVAFYTGLLGMRETGRTTIADAGGEVVSLVTEDGGHELELNFYRYGSRFDTPYSVGEGIDHLAFRVEDLDQCIAQAREKGVQVRLEMKTPSSRWAYLEDPNGIWVEVFS